MRNLGKIAVVLLVLGAAVKSFASPADERGSIVVVFRNGHRQSFAISAITRIDFKSHAMIVYKDGHQENVAGEIAGIEFGDTPASAMTPSRAHFVGKWEVGDGNGRNFFITLNSDGDARKSVGAAHGTWTLVDGEARIIWDDGWRDAIRKVGGKHEKFAYEPGRSFDDSPSNVTAARNTEPKPI